MINLPTGSVPEGRDPNYTESKAIIATFTAQNAVVEIPNADRIAVIGEPAEQAEEGEITLAEETKPTLTKETLKALLEEVLAEQQEEKDRKALQDAVTAAANHSTEAKELAGKACKGVECLQEAINKIGGQLEGFTKALEEMPDPTPFPEIKPSVSMSAVPVQPITNPAPMVAPPVPVVQTPQEGHEEHNHDHPAHLSSTAMAEGVLDRIMSCDQCSPAMKAALKRRLHKYLPDYGVREEASGGDELHESEEEDKETQEGNGEHHPVARGEEPKVSGPAKAEAEAGSGAGGDEPEGSTDAASAVIEAGCSEPISQSDATEPSPESASDDDRKKYRDPLNWI